MPATVIQRIPGLSPRVRGKQGLDPPSPAILRSIPACAGEASSVRRKGLLRGVYPRVCGGSRMGEGLKDLVEGLSPRVRGKRPRLRCAALRLRSIPACAGEADAPVSTAPLAPVYPRVCGGSRFGPVDTYIEPGLSPRVRGKPRRLVGGRPFRRSIPACAGEAAGSARAVRQLQVYPRVCGGSAMASISLARKAGLSPRVRGKRRVVCNQGGRHRSIPACAGEARLPAGCEQHPEVYPRVCGGSAVARLV